MLAIGRALMTNPHLLILDEATEGLAPMILAEIRRVVGAIRATGMATLIVDRNDRAVVLEEGQVVMAGASDTLDGAELGQRQGASSIPALAVGPRECGLARPGYRSRMVAPKEQFRCDPRSGVRPARP